ncbi:MAG: hypothetical protein KDE48_08835 [Anaerolineales bacterium]|nr:hypothetical protein [Anaerolineales bacterium]
MSNPFTRFLNQWSSNSDFAEFIDHWDQLEAVVVAVYRQKMSSAEAAMTFDTVWFWLRAHYPTWESALRPYWQKTLVGGKKTSQDPFKYLITISHPDAILDDWFAMQQLPAAREALNQFLLAHS